MDTVKLKINGIDVEAPAGVSIVEAARLANINIPTLCYMKEINAIASCRVCICEVKGARAPVAACVYPVAEGMEVFTNTPAMRKARKTTLELILSDHNMECLSCVRSGKCELQTLAQEYGVYADNFKTTIAPRIVDVSDSIIRDNSKCILCRRCAAVCKYTQGVSAIGPTERGMDTQISTAFDKPLKNTTCINCGQCITVCPTGALRENDSTDAVWAALDDPKKHVVVGTAPAVRAQLGEEFGLKMGTNVEGKMAESLRMLGFDGVFDVDTAADFTIMEEGTELLERLKNGGALPLITSCSPGWIKYCETFFPEFTANLSSCKSPQQMFGALMKSYYAEKMGIDPKDLFVVTVMPCTAKKFEIKRDNQAAVNGLPDIDATITTREYARMLRRSGIDFAALPNDAKFDPMFGIASGAADIFGATGGVMEAALRTVYEIVTGKEAAPLDFTAVRGTQGIKEATVDVGGTPVRVAIVSGTKNAGELLTAIKNGEKQYEFVEVMACPGGCVNGGGQPQQPGYVRNFVDIQAERAKALYSEDAAKTLRKSHENPIVKEVYATYLEKPGSHKAHELLHTTYVKRSKY